MARATGLSAAIAALTLVLGAAPAQAACGGVKRASPPQRTADTRPPLVIGDSVLLGAVRQVAGAGFEVNTRGCRQISEGLRLMRARRRAGTLPRLVVVALGTNWVIRASDIGAALRIAGPGRVLALVTPREEGGGGGSDASTIRAAGRRHPGRIRVLDWVRYSRGRSGWFAGDGIHLGRGGAAGFARLLRTVRRLTVDAPCD